MHGPLKILMTLKILKILMTLIDGASSLAHIRRHVPVADVAVFCHNSLRLSSAGEIIPNGATNSCVR